MRALGDPIWPRTRVRYDMEDRIRGAAPYRLQPDRLPRFAPVRRIVRATIVQAWP